MKNQQVLSWDHNMKHTSFSFTLPKFLFCFLVIFSFPYFFYSFNTLLSFNLPKPETSNFFRYTNLPHPSNPLLPEKPNRTLSSADEPPLQNLKTQLNTTINHVVFGIGAYAKLWDRRKQYVKLWWKPDKMRGIIWLDKPVKTDPSDDHLLPTAMISSDTSEFLYDNTEGERSAIQISRIISETLKLGMNDVRWFVMGNDDTVFIADNLVKVLSKYDHNQYYYIESSSKSHIQNITVAKLATDSIAVANLAIVICYPFWCHMLVSF